MSRRRAFWVAVAVGLAVIAALSVAGRLRLRAAQPAEPLAPWAPDPGPTAVATAPSEPQESAVQTQPAVELRTEDEQPLPTWVRLTIVGVALLAFLAVSLIATKGV